MKAKTQTAGIRRFGEANKTETMIKLIVIVGCLASAGCATSPSTLTSARSVPAQRIAHLPMASNPKMAARITILRDVGFAGSAATVKLRLNGNPVASFHPRESLTFTLDPGEYVFGVKPVPDLGSGLNELSLTAKAGEHYFFRISSTYAGFILQRSYEINR
jgi:hypothetical protein